MEIIQASSRSDLGSMFDEVKGGGPGGQAPLVKQGGLGGRQAPQHYIIEN